MFSMFFERKSRKWMVVPVAPELIQGLQERPSIYLILSCYGNGLFYSSVVRSLLCEPVLPVL